MSDKNLDQKYQAFKDEENVDTSVNHDDVSMEQLNVKDKSELENSVNVENRQETRKEINKQLDEADIGENIIEKEFCDYVDERDGKPLVNLQIQDDEEEGNFYYFLIYIR